MRQVIKTLMDDDISAVQIINYRDYTVEVYRSLTDRVWQTTINEALDRQSNGGPRVTRYGVKKNRYWIEYLKVAKL